MESRRGPGDRGGFPCPQSALAGAWPLEPGKTQLIAKYEHTTADQGYDADAALVDIDPVETRPCRSSSSAV
ncbi:hypothetical protein ACRAWD_19380 [Caulobacter segnis]